jgi:DNA helicase-2/ATP-dependent DNA helicase PcrA
MGNLLENLNKEQALAVTHKNGPLLIVAGAGTGKTTVITRRIAHLIEQGLAKPDEILALTFTDKAAGEMQERADLLLPLGYYDMWISTFHSFCERILKNHALDIGLSNDFKLLDDVGQWVLVLKNFEKFNLEYYRPLGSPNRFISALLKHFSRCKDELITPEDYLKYAEDLKLATDVAEGVGAAIGRQKKNDPNTKTADLSAEALAKADKSANYTADNQSETLRIQEVANAYHVYQKLLLDNNYLDFGDLINYTLELFKKRPKILEYYSKKFKFIMVDEFQDTNFAQYQLVKLLSENSTTPTRSAGHPSFEKEGNAPRLSESSAKRRSLSSFSRRSTAEGGEVVGDGHRSNLVVVGDDDQSIYKFRGASVSNILKFKQDYKDAKQITLIQNYRSTQNILDLAYNFIQANNPDRLEIKLNIDKKLKANAAQSESVIEVLEADDLSGELNAVAKKILEIKSKDKNSSWNDFAVLVRANSAAEEFLPVLDISGIPYTFVANKGLFKKEIVVDILSYMRLLDNAHDSQNLYRIFSLPKFRLEHKELSSLLMFAKQKTLSLFEALTPGQALPDISDEGKKRIKNLLDLLQKHSAEAKTSTAAEMMVKIVRDLGLEQKLKEETAQNAEARELLDQFYKKIEEFEKQEDHKDLHNFLHSLDLEMEAGSEGVIKFDPNQGPESVKVMTIHSAKGLEFSYVFIINLVEQRFPTREKSDAIEIPEALIKDILPEGDFHLQEERRLFYVAITRARRYLYLTWAKNYGGARTKKPSQFLLETNLVPSEKISKATGKVIFEKKTAKTNKQAVYANLPVKFSYTDLTTFQTCPLQYKYERYLKLPLPGSHHQSFGNTVHKTFEDFLKLYKNNSKIDQTDLFGKKASDNPLPDFKFLEKLYQNNWIDDWYPKKDEKEKYRKIGLEMLKYFYNDLKDNKPRVEFIEQFFKLKLKDYDFVGKIDRADQKSNGLEIIDYKTGKTPKAKTDLDQLYVYQWAAQEFLRLPVQSLKYWYLRDNKFVEEPKADDKEIMRLKNELLDLIEKIILTTKYDLFLEEDQKLIHHECEFRYLE